MKELALRLSISILNKMVNQGYTFISMNYPRELISSSLISYSFDIFDEKTKEILSVYVFLTDDNLISFCISDNISYSFETDDIEEFLEEIK